MSAQMHVEMERGQPLPSPPTKIEMDRGGDERSLDNDEDAWWAKDKK
jgi:hypothetical protein